MIIETKTVRCDICGGKIEKAPFCGYLGATYMISNMFGRKTKADICDSCQDIIKEKRIKAEKAKPPRNCDVGTAEEQWERYCKFTDRYNPCSYKGNARCAEDCPIHIKLKREGHGELLCQLEWAQMPYVESEAGKGGKE